MTKKFKAHLAVLFANILFGINYSAVQQITPRLIQPFGLNVIRVGVSSFLFWILPLVYKTNVSIKRKHYGRFALCSLTGVVINQLLFIKGLSMTLVIHAALLSLVTPIFITLTAAYFLKENLSTWKVAGLILGITGAAMLVLRKESNGKAAHVVLGDILIIINAVSYAFYFVLVKPLMKEYRPMNVLRWVFTLALPVMIIVGMEELLAIDWNRFRVWDYGFLAINVLGATFLAYSLNLYALQKLGASVTGAYIYSQPFFATLIAVFFLKETLTWYKVASAILILAGVFLTSKNNGSKKLSAV